MNGEISQNLINKIKAVLVPKISDFVANSVIRVTCKRIETDPANLDVSQLTEFADKMKTSLLLFLEEKEVAEITQKIKSIVI